jgi:ketosteroid isomerase-like protein
MSNQNAQLIRDGYAAFAQGDIATVLELFDEDIDWHVPGRSPLSGDYHGHEGVLGFFTKSMELSSGTLKVDVDDVVADGDRVVVFSTVSAQRNGRSLSTPEVHCWRPADGKAVEFREFQGDQQREDEFWIG